ncbi:MAG TPA: DUF5703 domain-containing protein [Fimbriimonadaceae bacterium]|nr:DUF5703 domain-containing protein [Fimbriimonadaceae bacterium]HRJ95336.1 DUF5703 domain-containing protein [Fimbriimonadaceae bacterium]
MRAQLAVLLSGVPLLASSSPIDRCDVVWTTPSKNSSGSMPIGNGTVGLNAWVEEGGDLVLLVSRTDAWSEACRLLKLGRVRLSLSPNPFATGKPLRQRLHLEDGLIEIEADGCRLRVFVDAEHPVAWIVGKSSKGMSVRARLETWRTARRSLQGSELESAWTMKGSPRPVWESPDLAAKDGEAGVVYHRNEGSIVPETIEHQGLGPIRQTIDDPLRDRCFGTRLASLELKSISVTSDAVVLASATPVRKFGVQIVTASEQTATDTAFIGGLRRQAMATRDSVAAERRTVHWWRSFWSRSHVFTGNLQIDRAYALQRWITACGGRGEYPIKFNGSIFTVEPSVTGGPDHNPDWRRWGDAYWWQNTRMPYAPLPASGDFDLMHSLFGLYERTRPACEARASLYYGAGGVYFPETMTIFGTYANGDYGWDRTGRKPSEVLCPWWQYAWQQGLELLVLMLDYSEYSGDRKFVKTRLAPMARSVLAYYDTRFPRDAFGQLTIIPTQSAETYWFGVVNDTPSVAGLHTVIERLSPHRNALTAEDRARLDRLREALPPIPLGKRDGKIIIEPAAKNKKDRNNVENPELYALWPFRIYGVGRLNLEVAQNTFLSRIEKSNSGWQYDGQCAAIAGLAHEAAKSLLAKVANSNPAYRFPAMWGPNYDWLPDQCHGGNIMSTLQAMLLQADRGKIYILPAWPRDWDVRFKLWAPGRTVVEAEVRGGTIVRLDVSPAARRKDVVLPAAMATRLRK